jgi:peptidoglycan/LPS O-acetylase OafA/YrhL
MELAVNAGKRNSTLDVLRGLAVLLVMFHHIKLINKDAFSNPVLKIARYILTPMVRGGWIGVDLFFILSGFLVSGLLFTEYKNTGSFRPGSFLIRRGFKLYPSLFFFILVAFLFELQYNLHQGLVPSRSRTT